MSDDVAQKYLIYPHKNPTHVKNSSSDISNPVYI